MKKLLLAGLLSALLIWTTTGTPATNLNNSEAMAAANQTAGQRHNSGLLTAKPTEQAPKVQAAAPTQGNGTKLETSEPQPEQPPASPKDIAKATLEDLGQSDAWYAVQYIGHKESSWNPTAINNIGACGLFQALPCSKMNCNLQDVSCQVRWATNYATQRYGSWHNAYQFWRSNGWW